MAIPRSSPYDYPSLFAEERARLLGLLRSLERGAWARPTRCPGWTVADVARHLLGDDLYRISHSRDGHHGAVPPAGIDGSGFADWLDGVQVAWVEAARRISPRLVVELLEATGVVVRAVLAAEDPEELTGAVSWASDAPVPAWMDHGRELSEHWIHRQQMLDALGRGPDLAPAATAAVLEVLRWSYPHRLAAALARPGDAVLISVAGPVTLQWTLRFGGDEWTFATDGGHPSGKQRLEEPERAAAPAAELVLSTDQAWRLLSNNLPPGAEDRLWARGEPAIVEALLDTRAVIGRPVHR